MIFVTVGTHEQQFNRLIEEIDRLKGNGIIKDEVVMQTGYCTYEPKYCEWSELLPYDQMLENVEKADIVIADVPCSGYGVIGKKPEIKYRVTPQKQEEIVILQRTILDRAANYVKPRGELIFSTCTIAKEENEENMMWFLQNYPFKLESLDPYLPEELHSETTALGYLQLLPGVHKTDGFFIAKFRRK